MEVWSRWTLRIDRLAGPCWPGSALPRQEQGWGRNPVAHQLFDRPAVVGDAGRHGRGACQPLARSVRLEQAQALMAGAEVIDGPDQVRASLQGAGLSSQGATSAHERTEAGSEGGIEPLD